MGVKSETLRRWERDGLFTLPGFLTSQRRRRLQLACDHALERVRATSTEQGHTSTHVPNLLDPHLFEDDSAALDLLVRLASSDEVLRVMHDLQPPSGEALQLRDVQYFHEPSRRDADGLWHRDGDRSLMRFRIAFAPDDHLQYVLGSHRRADSDEERAVLSGSDRNGPGPAGATRVQLRAGDAVVFDAGGIHRARYRAASVRRTLDLVFRFGLPRPRFGPLGLALAPRHR